jgi:hypothetical protein
MLTALGGRPPMRRVHQHPVTHRDPHHQRGARDKPGGLRHHVEAAEDD